MERVGGVVVGIDQGTANCGLAIDRRLLGGGISGMKIGVRVWPGNTFRGALETFGTIVRVVRGIPEKIALIAVEGRAYGMTSRKIEDGKKVAGYNLAGLWHLDTMIQLYAAANDIPLLIVSPLSVKRFAGGKGSGRMTKKEVGVAMRKLGLGAKDKDIQDAIAIANLASAALLAEAERGGDADASAALRRVYNADQLAYIRKIFRSTIEREFLVEWPEVGR